MTQQALIDGLRVVHGQIRDVPVSLFSIVRNERFFSEAFCDHYRRLGVEQFVIMDDNSDDGTRQYLTQQSDCAVPASPVAFATTISLTTGHWRAGKKMLAGTKLKSLIPKKFLFGKWAVYADADEFLLLPRESQTLPALTAALDRQRCDCVVASLIEFYPEKVARSAERQPARQCSDLIRLSPCYDGQALLDVSPSGFARKVAGSASGRLFAKFGVRQAPRGRNAGARMIDRLVGRIPVASATKKTPSLKTTDRVFLVGSHKASVKPTGALVLAMAHFTHTPDLIQRTVSATGERMWSGRKKKYGYYCELLRAMQAAAGRFTDAISRRFTSSEELKLCGLMMVR